MSKEQFELAKLISNYLQGTLSAKEEADLLSRAEKDVLLRQLLEQYLDTSMLTDELARVDDIDKEEDWKLVLHKYAQSKPNRKQLNWFKWKWLSMAAAFLLMCGIAWWKLPHENKNNIVADHQYGYQNDVLPGINKAILTLPSGKRILLEGDSVAFKEGRAVSANKSIHYDDSRNPADILTQVSVPKGGNYQLKLPDGSKVWLNAASILEFPAAFMEKERVVKLLVGEAYFEVAPKSNSPFIVYTNQVHIEALGTEFNINAYANHQTKTILTEGKVKVSNQQDQKIITPGYAVSSYAGKLSVQKADLEEALSWKDGYFYFDGKDLYQILEEVARWYNVDVKYNTKISKERYRGGIKRSVTLGGVCQMLTDLSGHQFAIEEKILTVI